MRRTRRDMIFDAINYTLVSFFFLLILYPLYFIIIASISNPDYVNTGLITFLPREITLEGYARTFREANVWRGYRNTILYTTLGTTINVALTMSAAYALSRKELSGRSVIMRLIVFTMLFSGGIIPTYLIVKGLGMTNTLWAMVIPNAVSAWNLIIASTHRGAADDVKTLQEMQRIADLMKYALIIVASFPVMVLNPFLQRYFVKGVMVGAIK